MVDDGPDASDCMRFIAYDTRALPFARVLADDVFQTPSLALLHETVLASRDRQPRSAPKLGYGDNMALRALLAAQPDSSRFFALYREMLRTVMVAAFDCALKYNQRPTFRVHLAGTPSVSNWHTDYEVTRASDQLTAWVPFVDCADSATLWVEAHYGRADYRPVPVRYGEILIFDGGFLQHGSVPNQTPYTRVSMDFRFTPTLGAGAKPPTDMGVLAGRPPGYRPPAKAERRGSRY